MVFFDLELTFVDRDFVDKLAPGLGLLFWIAVQWPNSLLFPGLPLVLDGPFPATQIFMYLSLVSVFRWFYSPTQLGLSFLFMLLF